MILDIQLKAYLTEHGTQCKETLAQLVFVLAAGTDIGICYRLKDSRTKAMHLALTAAVERCLDSYLWDSAHDHLFDSAVKLTIEIFKQCPKGAVLALGYATWLCTRALNQTITMQDIADLAIYD